MNEFGLRRRVTVSIGGIGRPECSVQKLIQGCYENICRTGRRLVQLFSHLFYCFQAVPTFDIETMECLVRRMLQGSSLKMECILLDSQLYENSCSKGSVISNGINQCGLLGRCMLSMGYVSGNE